METNINYQLTHVLSFLEDMVSYLQTFFLSTVKTAQILESFNPIGPWRFFDACVSGWWVLFDPPPLVNGLFTQKMCHFLSWANSCYYLSCILKFVANFSSILTILAFLTNFYENWSTNMLYTSKESKNYLEIDIIAEKYDLCKKKP